MPALKHCPGQGLSPWAPSCMAGSQTDMGPLGHARGTAQHRALLSWEACVPPWGPPTCEVAPRPCRLSSERSFVARQDVGDGAPG